MTSLLFLQNAGVRTNAPSLERESTAQNEPVGQRPDPSRAARLEGCPRSWENRYVMTSARLAVLSVAVAIGAIAAYVLLLRVVIVRNHPEGYVVAFTLATALAALAVARAGGRRWPAWLALTLSGGLLVAGAWFNFVAARVPDTPTPLRLGERPPEFTLPDATGRPVSLEDYRGQKPVVLVFYRGYW
jgi:AhpC/TSA family protein